MSGTTKRAVILTAIYEETRAVLRYLGGQTTENVSGTGFFKGQFEGWEVAVTEVGPGNVSAAAIATRALGHYKPDVALFVGVAGGVKDVAIGDVVVATKVYGYESGKDAGGGFKARPDLVHTAHDLEQRARLLRQSEDWKKRLDPTVERQRSPAVFVGPIAAGEKVVASTRSASARLIGEHYSDALAVEMEGRGFLEGVHISHPVQGCVVRGISDLLSGKAGADEAGSKRLAADAAGAVAFEILSARGGAETTREPARKFIETPVTFSPSAYFKPREVLAKMGLPNVDQVSYLFDGVPSAFLRIIPGKARERPFPLASLKQAAEQTGLLRVSGHGGFSDINKYGAIYYDPGHPRPGGSAPLHVATQLFQNGELWSVSDYILIRERGWRPEWVPIPLVPALDLERAFYLALHRNIALSVKALDLSFPCTVVLGLVGIADAYLGVHLDDIRGPIRAHEANVRKELRSADTAAINELLLEFFNEVHDKTGYPRPSGLYGFPPGPPHE